MSLVQRPQILLILFCSFASGALAQESDLLAREEASRRLAYQLYPEARDNSSLLGKTVKEVVAAAAQQHPDFFNNPDWPMIITKACADEIKKRQTVAQQYSAQPIQPNGENNTLDQYQALERKAELAAQQQEIAPDQQLESEQAEARERAEEERVKSHRRRVESERVESERKEKEALTSRARSEVEALETNLFLHKPVSFTEKFSIETTVGSDVRQADDSGIRHRYEESLRKIDDQNREAEEAQRKIESERREQEDRLRREEAEKRQKDSNNQFSRP